MRGGSEETSGVDEVVVEKTAKIVSSILVKAVAEVICTEEEPGAPSQNLVGCWCHLVAFHHLSVCLLKCQILQ